MAFKNEVFIVGNAGAMTGQALSVDTIPEGFPGVQIYAADDEDDETVVNLTVAQAERLIVEIRKIIDNN